jgi:hypothetical protein
MMGNFLFLATAGKGGVGLNLDLIETNLFNLTLVLVKKRLHPPWM